MARYPKDKKGWDYVDPSDPKGYYAYFGLMPSSDTKAITLAYIKILEKCDGNQFVITLAKEAYEVLSDPIKRKHYDTLLDTDVKKTSRKTKGAAGASKRNKSYTTVRPTEFRLMGQPAESRDPLTPSEIKQNFIKRQSLESGDIGCTILLFGAIYGLWFFFS
jgi:hypothetical protein